MRFNKLCIATAMAAVPLCAFASEGVQSETEKIDYLPRIHGVLRTRYEAEFPDWEQRFQVRNARVSVEGDVLRSLSYFVRVDACDRGKIKMLDAWARWKFLPDWDVQAGQMRVPFGVGVFRGPGDYYFANRTFMAKQIANLYQVGLKLAWHGTPSVPLTLEAGVYNSSPMGDHEVWQNAMDFAGKAIWQVGNVALSTSFLTMKPYGVRMNVVDGGVSWKFFRWFIEGEYQHLHYVGGAYKDVHAWNMMASYGLPLSRGVFDKLSFQGRFDGMSDHSAGTPDADGRLITDDYARRRLTLGTSISYTHKPVKAELHLNYENYFFDRGVEVPRGSRDKLVAELVIKF